LTCLLRAGGFPGFHGSSWRFPVQTGNGTGNVEGNGLRQTSNHGRLELEALGAGCAHGRYPVLKAPTGAGGSAPKLRCRDGQRFETGAIEVRSKKSGQALWADQLLDLLRRRELTS
jgi:hypothetical protein